MRPALALIVLAGCAPVWAPPPREIALAERMLARAEGAPFAELAADEIDAAEAALLAARRAHAEAPGSARAADEAYLAWRAAEGAWIAGRCAAARAALLKSRREAATVARDLARKQALAAAVARRREALSAARAEAHRALREALTAAEDEGLRVLDRPDATVVRFSAEELFLPGTSLFRDGGEDRIAALSRALALAPPYELRFAIVDDIEGFRTAPALLADRRRARICDAMCARGVPADALGGRAVRPPPGAQIDVLVIAPEPRLPAE